MFQSLDLLKMNLGFEWAQKMSQFLFFIFRCKLVKLGKKMGLKALDATTMKIEIMKINMNARNKMST